MTAPHEIQAQSREWSTVGLSGPEQFGVWEQTVNEAFVPVTVRAATPERFPSGVQVRHVGGIDVADIVSEPQTVTRTAADARRSPGDVYFLNLPLTGGTTAEQDGRTVRLRGGDFALVDGDQPFGLGFEAAFEQISLKIPRELVESRVRRPRELVARRIRGDRGVGAVASAAIRATAAIMSTLDQQSARALGERLADLVALAAGDLSAQRVVPDRLLWRTIRDEAERGLSDPSLSPAAVAGRAGISVRHLHRLFAQNGQSFGRWVLARRLELAFADLVDPQLAERPIARIALDRGFGDPSYFSRVFRSRYELTPRELRASAVRRSSAPSSDNRAAQS